MNGKLRQGVRRALTKIQSASIKYANSQRTNADTQEWLEAQEWLLNYIARNYVSRDDYEWIKKRFDYREQAQTKTDELVEFIERTIDKNDKRNSLTNTYYNCILEVG